MAIAFDATTNSRITGPALSTTFNHTPVGTPKGVFVTIAYGGSGGSISDQTVTYGGVAMTKITSRGVGPSNSVLFFLGTNIPTGTQSVVATLVGSFRTSNKCTVQVITVTAGAGKSTRDAGSGTYATGPDATVTISPSGGGASYGCGVVSAQDSTIDPGTGMTQRGTDVDLNDNGYYSATVSSTSENASGNITISTVNSQFSAMAAMAIEEFTSSAIKTVNGLAKASVKTVNGLAIGSVKTYNGLA